MTTIRHPRHLLHLGLVLGLLTLGTALGTTPAQAQLQTGSALYFDHPPEDAADTAKYQLCVDGVSDATCSDLAVLRGAETPTLVTFSFTLPGTVPRGNRILQVRAVGHGDFGASAGSNAISQRIIGKPGPPVNFRLQAAVVSYFNRQPG